MMEALFAWIQRFVVLCLLFGALTYLIPEDTYRKYLKFFLELLLVLYLLNPIFHAMGGGWEERFEGYYSQFFEQMEQRQREAESYAFLDENYISYLLAGGTEE